MYISFIIPCFNCDKIIKSSILKLKNKLSKFKKIKYELIFIDDGSVDNTSKIIRNFKSKNIRLIINKMGNYGKYICNRYIYGNKIKPRLALKIANIIVKTVI